MACLQYQAPRFVRVAGAAAEAGCVTRGMVAGCGMAVALLQSYLGPLARNIRVQEGGKGTRVRTYVDDLTLAKLAQRRRSRKLWSEPMAWQRTALGK